MKIVIIGLGTIGETILKSLAGEGHTITIIDENRRVVETLIEKYDVFGVVGIVLLLATTKPLVGRGYLYPLIPFNGKALARLLFRLKKKC